MAEFGPALPPGLTRKREDEEKGDVAKTSHRTGPTTAEGLSGRTGDAFGPVLPPGLKNSTPTHCHSSSEMIGPVLPAHLNESAEDEEVVIGPLPPSSGRQEAVIPPNYCIRLRYKLDN